MLTSNDIKVSKINHYLSEIVRNGWKDQSIKNKVHMFKKQGKYEDFLALKCAYELYKLNLKS